MTSRSCLMSVRPSGCHSGPETFSHCSSQCERSGLCYHVMSPSLTARSAVRFCRNQNNRKHHDRYHTAAVHVRLYRGAAIQGQQHRRVVQRMQTEFWIHVALKYCMHVFGFPPQGKFYRCTDEAKSSPEECKLVSPVGFLNSQSLTVITLVSVSYLNATCRVLTGAPTSCIRMEMWTSQPSTNDCGTTATSTSTTSSWPWWLCSLCPLLKAGLRKS